ncbi:MAG: transcription elongation factor GreA [Patescibacteria group bacterium]
MKKVQMTQEGYDNLLKELTELKDVKKPAVLDRLAKARAMGDLRENSEYQAAREDQGFIEGRILELEELIKNAMVATNDDDPNTVQIGSKVTVKTPQGDVTYHIVGEFEADPMNKKLSQSSPIGKALVGKKLKDDVTVEVPAGKMTYTILKIEN